MAAIDKAVGGPSERELRWFGVLVFAVFAVFGGVVLWQLESLLAAQVLWGIGVAFALVYYTVRPLRWPLHALWMRLTAPLGWAVSHLVLAVIYYGIITPVGLVMRLFGRDALTRRFEPAAESYWVVRDSDGKPARYLRQS
jgi:hypothetical protein